MFESLVFFIWRFSGFVDLNDEDQNELKDKFGTTTTTNSKRKRKGGSINNASTQAKQAKVEDMSSETQDEQEETRLKKVICFRFT